MDEGGCIILCKVRGSSAGKFEKEKKKDNVHMMQTDFEVGYKARI